MKKICLILAVMLALLSTAALAGTFSKSTTAPSTNLIEYLAATTDKGLMIARDGFWNRGSGQTFKHSEDYNMSAITFVGKIHGDDEPGPYNLPSGAVVDMRVLKDATGADDVLDTEIANDTFDVGGQSIALGEYITFTFSSPIGPLDANTLHGVELWFTSEAVGHKFLLARNDVIDPDQYPNGGTIFMGGYGDPDDFPSMNQTDNNNDAWFYVQGTEVSAVDDWMMFD